MMIQDYIKRYFEEEKLFLEASPNSTEEQAMEHPKDITEVETPEKSNTISERNKLMLGFSLVLCILCTLLAVYFLEPIIFQRSFNTIRLILGSLLLVMIFFALTMFLTAFKKRELFIDRNGVKYEVQGREQSYHRWTSLEMIKLYRTGGEIATVTLQIGQQERSTAITSSEIPTDALRKAFKLIKRYAAYHDIEVANKIGW